jgi:hypothetical protein
MLDALQKFPRARQARCAEDARGGALLERGATMSIDGGNSMGQIAGTFAMERVIERARTTGVAAAALRGSNHCGAMDQYARMAIASGIPLNDATLADLAGVARRFGVVIPNEWTRPQLQTE